MFDFIKIILSLCLINLSQSYQSEISFLIESVKRECFHQFFLNDLIIEIDYQVLSGGDLDVSFWISSPSNRIIFTELKKQASQTKFKAEEKGEYRFCFDNSFARFQTKNVFFYISTDKEFEDPFISYSNEQYIKTIKDQLGIEFEGKIGIIQNQFNQVSSNLEKAKRFQHLFKGFELVDRNLMEDSFEKVNFWSLVNICVMICVGIIQVFTLKSLFETDSRFGKILRR
jgi:protein ERP2